MDVVIPRLNANDDAYVLLEWLVADGEHVTADAPVAVVETSKATTEVLAGGDGRLRRLAAIGSSCCSGSVIAQVGAPDDGDGGRSVGPPTAAPPGAVPSAEPRSGPLVTEPARALLAEHGITAAELAAELAQLPTSVVRRGDVEALLARRAATRAPAVGPEPEPEPAPVYEPGSEPLGRLQQAVARTVARSHATVPAAFTVVVVDVGAALRRAAELTRQVRRPIGLVELTVAAVAGAAGRFPLLFARLDDRDPADLRLRPATAAHIGVTVDLGEGLYIPVVRDAGALPLKELAMTLMRFRLAAVEGSFRDHDLSGANFTVAVHTEHDVLAAVPLIVPGQTAALAVGAPRPELRLVDGAVVERTVVHLGLAYDHRVVNGRGVAQFLAALREALEQP